MCKWGNTVNQKVLIPANLSYTDRDRWAIKPIDSCIADLVQALNDAGIYTAASCCGHNKAIGEIVLHDGRVLFVQVSH